MTKIAPISHTPAPSRPVDVLRDGDPYDPAVIQARLEAGRRAELTADQLPADLVGRATPSYFRTYDQLRTAMYDLQSRYPDLVEVRDIGDTAEKLAGGADRDLLALVLTNRAAPGDAGARPTTLNVAGIHAREIANPELLMTFATQLLEGHGRDAESTMLLDSRRMVLVPMLNPDGHAVVQRAYAGDRTGNLMQRKSTSAGDPRLGTDLNRNFDFHWGGAGASSSPRSETYRGPSAGSEPETQAVQRLVGELKPDFFVDWHSYSKLNMYPWGDVRTPTKDHDAYRALAQKFTTYNGYSPIQAVELYPTTGTTDDYGYGAHAVPSMAIETGASFHQTDAEFQRTLRENLPVLTYTAKVADAPFQRVHGPDAFDVVVDPATRAIEARVSDANNGRQALAGAELVLDTAAAPGTGVPLDAADGSFDSTEERVIGSVARAPGLAPDAGPGTLVYVRGRDVAGNWGPLSAQWLSEPAAAAAGVRGETAARGGITE